MLPLSRSATRGSPRAHAALLSVLAVLVGLEARAQDYRKTPYGPGKRTLWCGQAQASVRLDGELDEWALTDSIRINIEQVTSPLHHGNMGGVSDLDLVFRAMWDDAHLYLSADVTDDMVRAANPGAGEIPFFLVDGIAVYLDLGHDEDPDGQYRDGDHVFWFTATPERGPHSSGWVRGRDPGWGAWGPEAPGVEHAVRLTERGYRIEAAIPLGETALASNTARFRPPFEGRVVGLGIVVADNDADEPFGWPEAIERGEKQGTLDWGELTWPGTDDRQDTWGNLAFR